MVNRHDIRLCGFGGQGIVRAGYIIGQAASIFEHKNAVGAGYSSGWLYHWSGSIYL